MSLLAVSVTWLRLGPSLALIFAKISSWVTAFDSAIRSINNLKPLISNVFLIHPRQRWIKEDLLRLSLTFLWDSVEYRQSVQPLSVFPAHARYHYPIIAMCTSCRSMNSLSSFSECLPSRFAAHGGQRAACESCQTSNTYRTLAVSPMRRMISMTLSDGEIRLIIQCELYVWVRQGVRRIYHALSSFLIQPATRFFSSVSFLLFFLLLRRCFPLKQNERGKRMCCRRCRCPWLMPVDANVLVQFFSSFIDRVLIADCLFCFHLSLFSSFTIDSRGNTEQDVITSNTNQRNFVKAISIH